MQFDVLTLFPQMFKILDESIIGRAKEKGLININLVNIRDFSKNKHKKNGIQHHTNQNRVTPTA